MSRYSKQCELLCVMPAETDTAEIEQSLALEDELFRVGKTTCTTAVAMVAALHLTIRIAESLRKVSGDPYDLVHAVLSKMPGLAGETPATIDASSSSPVTVDLDEIGRVAAAFWRVVMTATGPAVANFTLLAFACRLSRPPSVFLLLEWMKQHRQEFSVVGPTTNDMRAAVTGAS